MVFSSLIFLYMFLPITLITYFLCPNKFRNVLLLIISLIFYSWGEPIYILLMIFSILFGYFGAILIEKNKKDLELKRFIFVTLIAVNITILVFFKYYGFLIDNINNIFSSHLKIKQLSLPLGISFYTFQIVSYIVDVYKGKVKCQKNLITFATYVSMFPQLVAGPIVQYSTIEKQLLDRNETSAKFTKGVERFIGGLGKKVILANSIGAVWTIVKENGFAGGVVLTYWIGIIAFTLQIYFDFSGYSDMAIGLGKMLGFDFLENFNYPYISKSITEFWRRWHISLGSWFRDYIYIPLGGNRRGLKIQIRNLFIVWFTTGLWHGASWNFVFWGVYFGVIIFLEKIALNKILRKVPSIIGNFYTMFLVVISWVFFDTNTIYEAFTYIKRMFGVGTEGFADSLSINLLSTNKMIFVLGILCSTPIFKILLQKIKGYKFGKIILIVLYFSIMFVSTSFLVGESYNPFLYFRF